MTTQSYWESAIERVNLTNALRRLDPAHDADELPEQPTRDHDDRYAHGHGEQVRRPQQEEREHQHDQAQERLEAEHGPVARRPQPERREVHHRAEEQHADRRGLLALDLDAEDEGDEVRGAEGGGEHGGGDERRRALAGRERRELGANLGVALLGAGVAPAHAVRGRSLARGGWSGGGPAGGLAGRGRRGRGPGAARAR